MKKGLAILLILSSSIYAGITDDFNSLKSEFALLFKADDVVGIATYENLSDDFAWLFYEVVVPGKAVLRVRSNDFSSPNQDAIRITREMLNAEHDRYKKEHLGQLRQKSYELLISAQRTKSKEDVLDGHSSDVQQ